MKLRVSSLAGKQAWWVLVFSLWAVLPALAEVRWVWSGGLGPEALRIKVKYENSAAGPLRIAPDHSPAAIREIAPVSIIPAGTGWVADYQVAGLRPDTAYHYTAGAVTARVRTLPTGPASFTLAFGSCAQTGSVHPVFATIAAHAPLFFLHTGDLHYEDIAVNEEAVFHAATDRALTAATQTQLFRRTAVAYMWDDHDYGPNNSDSSSPSREASQRAYRINVPHHPLVAAAAGPVYHAFTVGRVRFILTDLRSERSPRAVPEGPERSMLGATQKAWLKAELLAARDTHALVVWVGTVPWIGEEPEREGQDRWTGFTTERSELAAFIEQHGINNLCLLSGDAHMLAIDDGSNNRYGPAGRKSFPVFHAGALDRRGSVKGGPYSHGTFPGPGQFGLMKVHDDGGPQLRVEWSGRNHLDEELVRHSFAVPASSAR